MQLQKMAVWTSTRRASTHTTVLMPAPAQILCMVWHACKNPKRREQERHSPAHKSSWKEMINHIVHHMIFTVFWLSKLAATSSKYWERQVHQVLRFEADLLHQSLKWVGCACLINEVGSFTSDNGQLGPSRRSARFSYYDKEHLRICGLRKEVLHSLT